MPDRALSGTRVLEYGHHVSAPYCTKLLAELGAEVVKIEPPPGEEGRRIGPFAADRPHPERSLLFLYFNTGKKGITLNPADRCGKEIFLDLVRQSDILVENYPVGRMRELGLEYEVLRSANPKLVMVSITPFGQTGPHSRYKSYYLNTFHAGGEGYVLPGGLGWLLYSDRPPIRSGGYVGECASGVAAATAALAALYWQRASGAGQYIDISEQEVLLNVIRIEMSKYNDGWMETRANRALPVGGLVRCKDGFVQLMTNLPHMWDAFVAVMGNPPWAAEERFQFARIFQGYLSVGGGPGADVIQDRDRVNDYIKEWALQHTKEEIYYALQAKGISVGMVCTVRDMLNSKQLQHRRFFVEVQHAEAGRAKYPGPLARYSETPSSIGSAAPLLGEHNEEVYSRALGYSQADLVRLREAGII